MRYSYTRDQNGRFRSPVLDDESAAMRESSRSMSAPAPEGNSISGPDFFGFYKSEIEVLLSQDDSLLPSPSQVSQLFGELDEVERLKGSTEKTCQTKESNGMFSAGIGARLSEFKKERLHSLLRQSVSTLGREIDEMENPVRSIRHIRSCLKYKERYLSLDSSKQPLKKAKVDPACSDLNREHVQLDDDLRFILENEGPKVEELMKRHTDEISTTLDHMEKSLKGILNGVMTSCRTMTVLQKQKLRGMILKLPAGNRDRVAEIIEDSNPSLLNNSCDVVTVELDNLDNVTLWRLYYYVAAVGAASPT